MTQEILALCRAMGTAEDQEELLLPLTQAIREGLAGRLRPEILPEDCGSAFPLAAAMMVADRLSELTGRGNTGEVTSFTAGDLTIQKGSGSRTSKGLSQQAEELLAPWLRDDGFVFQGVEG